MVKKLICEISVLIVCLYSGYLLSQWLEYHIILGIEQFFITNDCSTDDDVTESYLNFYEELGYVYHDSTPNCGPDYIPQEVKLIHKLWNQKAKDLCDWIIVFDSDEFMYPSVDTSNVNNLIKTVVKKYDDSPNPILFLQ